MLCGLIMAGGSGKRFWPLSTEEKPKQLLKLFSDKTMVRETVDRILPLISAENIFVATNIAHYEAVRNELPMIDENNIIIEPMIKDTAAAIGYSSRIIRREREKPTILVLSSDHMIKDVDTFLEAVMIAKEEAVKSHSIITFGIKPSRPDTGYGYIKMKRKVDPLAQYKKARAEEAANKAKVISGGANSDLGIKDNVISNSSDFDLMKAYDIEAFLEKPDLEKAKEYVTDGGYFWNSGMFVFEARTVIMEMEKHMPKHHRVLKNLQYYIDQEYEGMELQHKVELLYDDFDKISFDYGIMEKTDNVRVIPIEVGWSDIGTFTAFEDVYDPDEKGNIVKNTSFDSFESKGNIVLTDNLEIKAIGMEDMVIVQTGNKLLICSKYEIDKMKEII